MSDALRETLVKYKKKEIAKQNKEKRPSEDTDMSKNLLLCSSRRNRSGMVWKPFGRVLW